MSSIQTIRMFVRVFELQNMSAAARDLQVSAAVASSRIGELEKHLGIRLFSRTTRSIRPTEQGRVFYPKALKVLEALDEAESAVHEVTQTPRGSIFVAAPLGVGKRLVAPHIPDFHAEFPDVHVRLRLSDRKVDVTQEGLDLAFVLGRLADSDMRMRHLANCQRVLCAAPAYIRRKGMPVQGADLQNGAHDCLLLRFPGSTEFRWTLETANGPQRFDISGPFACDDGDVLTHWALEGHGVINKPVFDVAEHLASGALVPVCLNDPPQSAQLACLYPIKRDQDPKIRLFMDFMAGRIKQALAERSALFQLPL